MFTDQVLYCWIRQDWPYYSQHIILGHAIGQPTNLLFYCEAQAQLGTEMKHFNMICTNHVEMFHFCAKLYKSSGNVSFLCQTVQIMWKCFISVPNCTNHVEICHFCAKLYKSCGNVSFLCQTVLGLDYR